ncbi:MAG: RidA family protein [Burkholderiales bacterium]|nr:RidA family protein [Burkholderiales bacterium]
MRFSITLFEQALGRAKERKSMKKKTYPLFYSGKKQQFARSVAVGDLLFLSGMSGRTMETGEVSSDDVAEQMKVALDKVRAALAEAGTSMDNIVKSVIYLKRAQDYDVMRRTEREYWTRHAPGLLEEPPASTFMQPVSLSKPDMLVEIDIIALIPQEP